MFRASLLFLTWFGVVRFSRGLDELSAIPVCENKSPEDAYLDLSNMSLRTIDRPLVSSNSVTCLNLAGNRLTSIAKSAFDDLPRLQYLNLAENPVSMKDFANLNLKKLITLVLDGPFPEDNVEHQAQNDIYYNYFISISLPQLEKISISHWESTNAAVIWLNSLNAPNLRQLYLIDSKIMAHSISEVIIANLTHMYLDDNELQLFTLLKNVKNLRHLSMNRNKIQSICGLNCNERFMTPLGLHSLEHLSLAGNEIETVESNAFDDLKNLRSLNLAENMIRYFPRHSFENMINLTNLTLDDNQLTEVPDICQLKNLKFLSINRNKISYVDESSFCNLPRLAIVHLSGNILTDIAVGTFRGLPRILTLDLSWNDIQSLPTNWTEGHSYIDELRLDGNKFSDIESMSLKGLQLLGSLSIGHNINIKRIMVGSLMELPMVTTIDVSRDCSPPRFSTTDLEGQ